ncbi:ADP-ribose pyrophosphatase YjhB, NUDIX family [Halogranum gelatinilyticum]|uniref:ADP-ribose pyrophosphatase YjhB, NUDIX family n=1 Tax=Halogranum gelatinilyticum TaxID=660521 RepID=A0A1G9PNY0_9EURY|nr:NUDIX hydrolase [Halogranum gelatinilyticum]SDM00526.1 ADP-ribose pyrophosphatase YjhB, NUDIX family [Halogranum gelatinilyticum]
MSDEHLQVTVSQKAALFGPSGDLLLLRRESNDAWDIPGGRLGASEDVVSGLRREVREETGLDIDVEGPVYTEAWETDAGDGRYAVVYRCATDERRVELGEEHHDWQWADPEAAVETVPAASDLRVALERAVTRQTVRR